ncbi:hypothetical protein J0X15_03140 [Roseibium sp. CAU 1637]|uniref:GP-PDE domain-containing protein n=1 Tax=Roseibium limicola TaxID=2816037 RepID=A0A939ELU3_9HYPH|nr:glycerophosphodiester phosphodiesterase family protein [Roseibium limicola]MBO0344206.1 hypothetical protein [Roseibium limicola]
MLISQDWIRKPRARPLSIAHRGASAYGFDNTLEAYRLAHHLEADLWEVDVHLTRDGVVVACHDADLRAVCGDRRAVADLDYEEVVRLSANAGREIPRFEAVIDLATQLNAGIYVDAKVQPAARAAIEVLGAREFERVIIGTSDPEFCRHLKQAGCPFAVSLLVGVGQDPFVLADQAKPDLIHPCWERAGARPDRLLDAAFFAKADMRGLPVVTWHEERPDVAAALCSLPVFGICSDAPELLRPYHDLFPDGPVIVCHRGLRSIAPENTLASVRAAFSAGFQFAEIDVHETADGEIVVLHDDTLDRTTSLSGLVAQRQFAEVSAADAGSHHGSFFAKERVPHLRQVLELAEQWGGRLYVELKQADPLKVARLVLDHMTLDRVFFWSFESSHMRALRQAFPDAQLMARPQDYASIDACLADYQPQILEFNVENATAENLSEIRSAGLQSMIAYMGRDLRLMGEMIALKPDILNLDEPFLARSLMSADQRLCESE